MRAGDGAGGQDAGGVGAAVDHADAQLGGARDQLFAGRGIQQGVAAVRDDRLELPRLDRLQQQLRRPTGHADVLDD